MEGSLKRYKDTNKFYYVVCVGPDPTRPGKYLQKKFTFEAVGKTETQLWKDAEEKARDLLKRFKTGENLDAGKMTVGGFLEEWMTKWVKPNLKAKTARWYANVVTKHIAPAIGNIKLTQLTPLHVLEMYNNSEGADTTLRSIHRTLHAAMERAYVWGFVPVNIMTKVDTPKVKKRKYTTLKADQAKTFLEVAKFNSNYYGFYLTALCAGLRLNEIAALKWDDIDYEKMKIRVDEQLLTEGDRLFGEVKTEASDDSVPMVGILADEFRRIRELQRIEREKVEATAKRKEGPAWEDYNLVFTQSKTPGRPINSKNLSNREFKELIDLTFIQIANPNIKVSWLNDEGVAELKKQVDIPEIRFHDLRHSCATLLRELGVDVETISKILRHSSRIITEQIYVHENIEMHRPALEKLEKLFG